MSSKDFDNEDIITEEFLKTMADRGLIIPRPMTFAEKLYNIAGAPWRAMKRVGEWFAWKIWGKRHHERQLAKQIDRMKFLSGVGSKTKHVSIVERAGYIDKSSADAVRLNTERKVVREELPKPDYDDSGLN